MATLRFTDDDRGPDGKILTLDQLLSSSRAAIARPPAASDELPDPFADHVEVPDRATPAKRPMTKAEIVSLLIVALIAVGVLYWLWRSASEIPAPAPPRPAGAVQSSEELAPTPVSHSPSPIPAGRLLIAFAAPDGQPLGAIESTRAITPTAHYGSAWIQADVQGSGLVWLRAADSPDLAIVGPDLAPRPTARPPLATATSDPPPCAQAGVPGQMVEVCGWGDLAAEARDKWLATYGGNAGVVTTPTPPEWSKP